jgi:DNA-binding MarR family transcriptional regulator
MPVISKRSRTPAGEALTSLILQLFRVNSLIFTAGDRLAAHLGLTGARWQILGAVIRAGQPQSVAWHARDLGTSRQNIQRIVNDLRGLGFTTFATNPQHRRAQLVVVTDKGRKVYEAAMALQAPWVNKISEDLTTRDLRAFERVLLSMREKLEDSRET